MINPSRVNDRPQAKAFSAACCASLELPSSFPHMPSTSRQATKPKPKAAAPRMWFVYLLRCANGALYTGIATDVAKRLVVHNAGKGSAYVRAHRPAVLVAFTAAMDRSAASKLEYAVKALSRAQKLALAKKWMAKAA